MIREPSDAVGGSVTHICFGSQSCKVNTTTTTTTTTTTNNNNNITTTTTGS